MRSQPVSRYDGVRIARRLFVYATTYQNGRRLERSLHSLDSLNPTGIYVVDNLSTDNTCELLEKFPNVKLTKFKCRRGTGRDIALKQILKVAKPDDCIIQVDLDVIYKKPYVDFIKEKMKTIKHNEMYADMGSLSTAKTNIGLPWTPLNASEDTERFANAITRGIKVYRFRVSSEKAWDKYWDGETLPGGNMKADREARYESNSIGKYIRLFRHLIDDERGMAVKSFSGFYSMSTSKNAVTFTAFLSSYIVAKIKGIYVHDASLNNSELSTKKAIFIKP